jgi:type IV pilus assembly protein PilW
MKRAPATGLALAARRQRGMTLVELLVALALTGLVVLAAVATLSMSRQGLGNVDGAAQLRDNARFAITLLQQAAAQAGYRDLYDATYLSAQPIARAELESPLFVEGADASRINSAAERVQNDVVNASDLLLLRAMPSAKYALDGQRDQVSQNDSAQQASDQALVNCLGYALSAAPSSPTDTIDSYFYVQQESSDGEPALYCSAYSNSGSLVSQPIVRGVENLQVLYGVNSNASPNTLDDNASFQFKSASQISQAQQWQQVRSIRIGMVLRSSPLSATAPAERTYYPLGPAYADAENGRWQAQDDGRLRLATTFSLGLRNAIDR